MFWCFGVIFANAQKYTDFMGLSMDRQSVEFENMLLSKGFEHKSSFVGEHWNTRIFYGTFQGVYTSVFLNEAFDSKRLATASIGFWSEVDDTLSAKMLFVEKYKELQGKYGDMTYFTEDPESDFRFSNLNIYFNENRICLSTVRMESGHSDFLKPGEKFWIITVTYYPLAFKPEE